jgi:hypothetical protein
VARMLLQDNEGLTHLSYPIQRYHMLQLVREEGLWMPLCATIYYKSVPEPYKHDESRATCLQCLTEAGKL